MALVLLKNPDFGDFHSDLPLLDSLHAWQSLRADLYRYRREIQNSRGADSGPHGDDSEDR
jgi:hypothetical protein